MRRSVCLLIVCLVIGTIAMPGCARSSREAPTAAAAPHTEPPEPTATSVSTEVAPTEKPTPASTPEAPPTVTPSPTPSPTAASEPAGDPTSSEARVLLEGRCTTCHSLDRVEAARKSPAEWESTVQRMLSIGAQVSESETAILVDYLAATYAP